MGDTETIVIDFAAPGAAERWRAVDDVVMGGRSASALVQAEDACVFQGEISLENGGGFASGRSDELPGAFAGSRTVVLRCRGDGRTYRLRLRTHRLPDDVSYLAPFETEAGAWTEHAFGAADFTATRRGRPVAGAPPLDLADVTSVGLLIADGRAGPFRLELRALARR